MDILKGIAAVIGMALWMVVCLIGVLLSTALTLGAFFLFFALVTGQLK